MPHGFRALYLAQAKCVNAVGHKPGRRGAVTLESGADFLSGLAAEAAAVRAAKAEADRLA